MKLKKIASLALAGVMAVSMLAGCSGNGSNGDNNNGGNTVVEPGTSSIVTAFNDGQDKDNKVKVTFSSDASLDAALQKAGKEVGSSATTLSVMRYVVGLMGKSYDSVNNFAGFAGAETPDRHIADKQSKTMIGVMMFASAGYWTEEDAIDAAAREVDEQIAEFAADNKNASKPNGTDDPDRVGDTYYTFDYTGTVSMVSVAQESGATNYYVVYTITQTAAQQTVKA